MCSQKWGNDVVEPAASITMISPMQLIYRLTDLLQSILSIE
jgi:hypothetical protein